MVSSKSQGSVQHLDSPPPPAQKSSETGNTIFFFSAGATHVFSIDLSIAPDWCCEGAGIHEDKASLCPLGNTAEYICFPLPLEMQKKSQVITLIKWQMLSKRILVVTWARKFCWGSWWRGDTVPLGPNHAFTVMLSSSPSPRQQ